MLKRRTIDFFKAQRTTSATTTASVQDDFKSEEKAEVLETPSGGGSKERSKNILSKIRKITLPALKKISISGMLYNFNISLNLQAIESEFINLSRNLEFWQYLSNCNLSKLSKFASNTFMTPARQSDINTVMDIIVPKIGSMLINLIHFESIICSTFSHRELSMIALHLLFHITRASNYNKVETIKCHIHPSAVNCPLGNKYYQQWNLSGYQFGQSKSVFISIDGSGGKLTRHNTGGDIFNLLKISKIHKNKNKNKNTSNDNSNSVGNEFLANPKRKTFNLGTKRASGNNNSNDSINGRVVSNRSSSNVSSLELSFLKSCRNYCYNHIPQRDNDTEKENFSTTMDELNKINFINLDSFEIDRLECRSMKALIDALNYICEFIDSLAKRISK